MGNIGNHSPGPRSSKDSFFNKMKKKPDVQAILDNLGNYTVEQLCELKGSHFPQWVRDALVRRKQGTSKSDILSRAEQIAEQMNAAAGAQIRNTELEDLPIIGEETPNDIPKERKITSVDFVSGEDRRTGVIFDSSPPEKHNDAGFDEHMRKVRERMRTIGK